jgi:hypothetical protein
MQRAVRCEGKEGFLVNWFSGLLLVLHIGGAIIAFGPTFAFPFIGAMGGKEPMHANFALRANEVVANRLVVPLALFQGVTGVLLIWNLGIDVFAHLWLLLGIVLYIAALAVAFGNQLPATRKLIELTSTPPPAPAPGAPAPSGPPPAVAALVRRVQIGGMVNVTLIVLIVILMVLGAEGVIS